VEEGSVLVVEDDPALRGVVARGLREAGLQVVTAGDGTSALNAVGAGPDTRFDAVVLDIGLPDSDGRDVCQALRARGMTSPVVFLTARDQLHDVLSGFAAGADDYLAKPFHFPELVLRIRALARRKPTAHGHTLRAAGIELDTISRTATRDGRPLQLSLKEFGLLEALLRASPAYLTATDLLRNVWDENADPFTKTVQVTIGRLRRKLGEPSIVETAAGVGYRISHPADATAAPADEAAKPTANP
jgi:DNA-binding response OmpR family regulator